MLMDIRAYVQDRGRASLSDIALHFRRDPEALRGMLAHWVAKGTLRHQIAAPSCAKSTGCGGCSCDASGFETYEFIAPAAEFGS
ncbi:FeoC-like transcriptional regulator [Rhodobacter ferrooxidans]|uniref:Transcriptional regulator HTH-type FeoC domain-containing protein n=1 Tax=Rhodobacter ferrooxidans TaxID=371731 RepID=C8S541_9RHOB|nr:FeoC-like transcriptional regulator [Rhodobacter sp. SW2]EEW23906.1 Protein of unknown function DUF1920 [Rhodobacter sp. SW2]